MFTAYQQCHRRDGSPNLCYPIPEWVGCVGASYESVGAVTDCNEITDVVDLLEDHMTNMNDVQRAVVQDAIDEIKRLRTVGSLNYSIAKHVEETEESKNAPYVELRKCIDKLEEAIRQLPKRNESIGGDRRDM